MGGGGGQGGRGVKARETMGREAGEEMAERRKGNGGKREF